MIHRLLKKVIYFFIAVILFLNASFASETNYKTNQIVQQQFSNYMDRVKEKIQKNWNPPDILELNRTIIVFKVDNEGEIVNCYIKESSGNIVFDESAMEALSDAAPFGHFPSNTTRNYITIVYNFETQNAEVEIMKDYLEKSDKLEGLDNKLALKYINMAIDEVRGDSSGYFLFARRAKIKKLLGDIEGYNADIEECERLKKLFDKKRIEACNKDLENAKTPFAYFNLANAYDIAGDYPKAIEAIDKAISMTKLNNSYKRYREEIIQRQQKQKNYIN